MKKVTRNEIQSRADYEKGREQFRRSVMAQKDSRRVHVGDYLTFLFENHDTVLYQIQEMIRAEGTSSESEIQHEIDTYNELLGDKGEIGCTLLIEIEDAARRPELLARWLNLPDTIYVATAAGKRIPAQFDARQVGEGRISSVQYLKFSVGDQIPVSVGCSHPDINAEARLTTAQTSALLQDLLSVSGS
jgi:hypothetical protein